MAPLTEDRDTIEQGTVETGYLVGANVKCFQGGLVVLDGGYAVPGKEATGLVAVGRCEELCDNIGGAAGAKTVIVRKGRFRYSNSAGEDLIAQADVGQLCYVVDDATVAKTNGGSPATRSIAGRIRGVEAGGVFVDVGTI
jgi:hypothetical protein